jgi:N,N'-diacetylchitobiose phosphorylase
MKDSRPISRHPSVYRAAVLSNGRYAVLLSAAGGGYSACNGFALTRWVPDPTLDEYGTTIFVRDLESRTFWPAHGGAAEHGGSHFTCDGRIARYVSSPDGLECELEIVVAGDRDLELRRLTIRNAGGSPRRLEVTSAAELSLNTPGADAAHPAFSKLFVQTDHVAEAGVLVANRRLRSPDDQPLFLAHSLIGGDGTLQWETDRARFIGRGGTRAVPAALASSSKLSGTTGAVLDPLFSLRRSIDLEAGAECDFTLVSAAADTRAGVLDLVATVADDQAIAAVFSAATTLEVNVEEDAAETLGLPPRWRECVELVHESGSRVRSGGGDAALTPAAPEIETKATSHPAGASSDPAFTARTADLASTLAFPNEWGGFSSDGREYVIILRRHENGLRRPPLPWVNVIANEQAGCIVSESGATYTWTANSRENRLTPWFNDPVIDPHGEALYIRDDESGVAWSPTPGPCPGQGDYIVRHGFGSTTFEHSSRGLEQETTMFVPVDAPARIARVRLTNTGAAPRAVTIFSYAQLVLGSHEAETRGLIETRHDPDTGALLATQADRGEFGDRVAVASTAGTGTVSWTTDRREFIGEGGSLAGPAAVVAGTLAARAGTGLDACLTQARSLVVEPGATVTCAFLLGEECDREAAMALANRFATVAAVNDALERARASWRERVGSVQVKTPSAALDIMVNGWLVYQNLSCRMWGRSAFYQSGGAFGFRDQLQDSSALLYADPAITRRQILLHAAHQFVEGDVLHWWHPPLSKGIRTRFSDDLLWLPYITAFYVAKTGDTGVLDEDVRFLHAPLLKPGEDETFLVPQDAGSSGTLWEHCCRAIDRSLTRGTHGLPLMGVGDWNDGMNRVGREGRGESVWLGFFLYDILRDFTALAEARDDASHRDAWRTHRASLGIALNDGGWDGEWYRRAYYDNGEPLGSARSDECRIDALAQAWAVISGAAPSDRAEQALDAMERHLVSRRDGIIRLLAPPFDRTPNDPGYIKGYLPGVRENGGQYTHGVIWAVKALAEHGRTESAAALLEMLTPVAHGSPTERAARYCVEPYVVAADIYGVDPHVGRGGWTWYTGSAGWMLRVALESVLGINLKGGSTLILKPCVPASWPHYTVQLRLEAGTTYIIEVERTDGASSATLAGSEPRAMIAASDGELAIPLMLDGGEHVVRVQLGPDVGPRYAPR